jgi:hypothetical protein
VADGLDGQATQPIPLRAMQPDQDQLGLLVRWSGGPGVAAWGLQGLDRVVTGLGSDAELRMALANGGDPGPDALPLAPQLELTTTDGVVAVLSLGRWGALPPPLATPIAKHQLLATWPLTAISRLHLELRSPVERVLQTYAIPLAEVADAVPGFRPDRLAGFRLLLDRSTPGLLWIADIAVVRGGAIS